MRVLIVDDEPEICRRLQRELQRKGCQAEYTTSPVGVLRRLKNAAQEAKAYALLLLDLRMPKVDSLSLLGEIREARLDLDVVIISTHGDEDKAIEAIRLGALDYLLKPISLEALRTVVFRVQQKRAAKEKKALEYSVLVVDDEKRLCARIQRELDKEGYRTAVAYDGVEGLDYFRHNRVDAAIVDIKMPRLGGLEMLEKCREITDDFVSIIITGHGDHERAVQALQSGVFNYLRKPISLEELVTSLNKGIEMLHLRRSLATRRRELEIETALKEQYAQDLEKITEERTKELGESEERYRLLVENANDAIFVLDSNLRVTDVNPFVEQAIGYSRDELVGRSFSELGIVAPASLGVAAENTARVFAGERTSGDVYEFITKDGEHLLGEVSGAPIYREGRVVSVLAIARDITARVRAEEAVREAERRYKAIFDNRLQMVYMHNEQGIFLDANDYALERLGYTRDDLGKISLQDMLYPEDLPRMLKGMADVWAKGFMEHPVELRLITKSGEMIWIETFGIPLERSVDHYIGLGLAHDITERKRAEETLSRLAIAVRMSTDGIVLSDIEAKIIEVNEAILEMYGTDDEGELIGKNSLDLIAPEDREKAIAGMEEVLEKGYAKNREYRVIAKNGGRIPVEMSVACIKDVEGKPIGFVGISRDITTRKRAEEEIKAKSQFLESLVRQSPLPTFIIDAEGTCVMVNQAFLEQYHVPDESLIIGHNALTVPANVERGTTEYMKRALSGEVVSTPEIEFISPIDGSITVTRSTLFPIYNPSGALTNVVVMQEDVTERVWSEETLRALNAAAVAVQRAARTPEAVFGVVMEQLQALGLAGAVVLLDETRERFVIRYTALVSRALARAEKLVGLKAAGYTFPVEQLPIGRQILAGETVFVPDVAALIAAPIVPMPARPLMPTAMRLLGMPRGVAAPLSVEGEIVGFLGVSAARMTAADTPAVTAFANQMAAALENAHLFQAEQRGREVAEALRETARVVNTSLDLDKVLSLILEQLAQVIEYDSSTVLLLDDSRFKVAAGRGFPDLEATLRFSYSVEEDTLSSAVVHARRPLIIEDVQSDPRWRPDPPTTHVHGWIGAPLIVKDRVIGVLALDSRRPGAYSQEDGQLVFAFADQAAVAIQNAQLYEQAQREIAERVQAEQSLQESEAHYRLLAENITDVIWTMDMNLQFTYVSPSVTSVGDYSVEEATALSLKDILTPASLEVAMKTIGEELEAEKTRQRGAFWSRVTELEQRRKDGSTVWTEVTTTFLRDPDDRPVGIMGVTRDIAKRKRAEAQRAAAQETLQRRNRELALLNRVIAAASAILEPKAVLEITCRELALALDVPQAAAALLDETRTTFIVVAEYLAEGRTSAMDAVIPVKDNPAMQYVVEHKAPLAIADAQHDPRLAAIHDVMRQRGAVSLLLVPLIVRGRVVGALGLNAVERREFSDEEIALAVNAVTAAAQALENARLFEAERQARRLSDTLSEIARELNAAPDLGAALDLVLSHMERVIAFDSGSILLLENGKMSVAAVRGFEEPERVLDTQLGLDTAPLNREIIETRRPLILGSVADDPRWLQSIEASGLTPDLAHIYSWMGIPLLVQDRVIGMLTADKAEPDFYRPQDAELALAFASHAAVAIERARLFDEIVAHNAALRRLSQAIEQAAEAIVITDIQGEIEYVNPAFEHITGYSRDEALGQNLHIIKSGEHDEAFFRELWQTILAGEVWRGSLTNRRKSGELYHEDMTITPVFDESGAIVNFVAIKHDITKRVRAEEEQERLLAQIRAQAHRVRQIIATVPEGMILLNPAGQVILANPVAERDMVVLAGARVGDTLTHLGDRPLTELLTSPPKGLWHEVMVPGSVGDRPERIFEVIARPIEPGPETEGWVLVIREVTQEREIQQRAQQQERLAAVGQLAAGIAHDFNNIMAAILLYAQLSAKSPDLPARVQERMTAIVEQSKRAADLINQILDFSRRAPLKQKLLNLETVLKKQIKLLQRTIPESIRIELVVGPDECTVNADLTRMQQVMMNLAVNARDAMPAGGTLRIGLERVQKELETETGIVDGEWVQLTVMDSGTGIPAEVLPHIFEPFYTTKKARKGTGLGLAQVYGIVKQHEGHIDVTTSMGKGTTFTVYLPALSPSEPERPAGEAAGLIQGQGETVLVVEDNPAARRALVESLEMLNYRVLEAENGREALALFERHGREIALVVSDLVMPKMGGMKLCSVLRRLDPAVRVVLLTGYPLESGSAELRAAGVMDWLLKPVGLNQLAQVVAQALQ